jgi:hypothetical protein
MVTDKERLASLEVKTVRAEQELESHESRIDALERSLISLVHEVKLIRYALFALAAGSAPETVKALLSLVGQ